jgi:hypothetical protein
MVTAEQVREIALGFPRAYEADVRGQIKFRVGRIVFAALSRDHSTLGLGFPRDERAALVESEPAKFHLPSTSDMRYQWIHASMAELDRDELEELLTDAWAMCVPKFLRAAWLDAHPPTNT